MTRKPGALFTGSGSLSIARTNAAASAITSRRVWRPTTTSTSIICATGLKKWMPDQARRDRRAPPAMSSSGMLDVFVARIASGFARRSMSANNARLASTFSKIASTITSARATPVAGDIGNEPVARVARPCARRAGAS